MELSYTKNIPIKHDVDVFVAGGGPAGIAAAVSAARQGKSVFIAEAFSAFGGAAVTMLVPAFMCFGDGVNFLAGGIGKEVYDRIGAESFPRFQRFCPESIPVETLKLIYDDMVVSSGAKFTFHTNIIDAVVEDGSIKYVVCASKGSVFAVRARVYIDCTGDGDLADCAGAASEFGDGEGRTMATTLCGIWTNINWDRVIAPPTRELERAFRDRVFTNEDRHLPGIWPIADQTADENGRRLPTGVGGSNAGHIYDVDARHADSLTEGIIKGRKQLLEYRKYFREYLTGYEDMELVWSAAYLGIRESRRITCDYRMVLSDFTDRAVFEDEIGRYCYPIDIHSPTNDKAGYEKFISEHTNMRYGPGESYGIPYRALAVSGIKNLLCAGRCICTDRHMQSSVRVMPGCYITGQAAGIAASVVCDSPDRDVHSPDVRLIQKKLKAMGAFLPNLRD